MMYVFIILLAFVLMFSPANAEVYISGKPLPSDEDSRYSQLPSYLRYPNDALSALMFKDSMKEIINEKCNYKFMLYTATANETPEIEQLVPAFEVNEKHYYFKEGMQPWYSIDIMHDDSVRTSALRNWVERADHLAFLINAHDIALRVPKPMRGKEFKNVSIYYIEQNELYNELHGFDESHLYCRVFYLGGQIYKKFILIAKKEDWAWRVEVNIPSASEEIEPTNFGPAGQTFGRFYPVK